MQKEPNKPLDKIKTSLLILLPLALFYTGIEVSPKNGLLILLLLLLVCTGGELTFSIKLQPIAAKLIEALSKLFR